MLRNYLMFLQITLQTILILTFIKPKSKITTKLTQSVYLFLKEL